MRSLVQDETKNRRMTQTPWEQSSLVGRLCLAGCENRENTAQQAILQKNLAEQEQARLQLEQTVKQREAELLKIKQERDDIILKSTAGSSQQAEQMQQHLKSLEEEKKRLDAEKLQLEEQKKQLDQQRANAVKSINTNVEKPQETIFVPAN